VIVSAEQHGAVRRREGVQELKRVVFVGLSHEHRPHCRTGQRAFEIADQIIHVAQEPAHFGIDREARVAERENVPNEPESHFRNDPVEHGVAGHECEVPRRPSPANGPDHVLDEPE
jgi:hypothetical protein